MRKVMGRCGLVFLWMALVALAGAPLRAAPGDEPARRLSPQGVRNLEAFTRLLGYLRFFHPSDQAAAANWDQVAIAGVQAVEDAADPADLAGRLEDFFRPLAPTLRVYVEGSRPAVPAELQPPAGVEDPPVTFWLHFGVRLTESHPPYFSRRLTNPGAPPEDTGLPLPADPLEVSLGSGVSALIPLTLYRNAQGGTIPSTTAPAPAPDKPAGWTPSGGDRATRLAIVALAWPVLQHFYPYFDVVAADWPAELRRALLAAAEDETERELVDTLRRLTAALQDGHARVQHPSWVLDHQLPLVWSWIDQQLVVTYADPAEVPQLAPGDIVLTLDGQPAQQVYRDELELAAGATPQHRRYRALQTMLLGPADSEVRLRVKKPHGGVEEVAVRRTRPVPGGLSGQMLVEPRPERISEVRPGIFYVDLDRISDEEFYEALDGLSAADAVIFDLRGYPWNLFTFDPIVTLASAPFRIALLNVPLTYFPDRQRVEYVTRGGFFLPFPLMPPRRAFLTDGRAISFAESYLGMVEHYKLAEIVGEASAGTNGNVNWITLPGGYRLRFTGMQVLKQDGSRHHGVGILPTVPVSPTYEGVLAGRDEVLEKAIEVVSPGPLPSTR